jgi:hypothetical protein
MKDEKQETGVLATYGTLIHARANAARMSLDERGKNIAKTRNMEIANSIASLFYFRIFIPSRFRDPAPSVFCLCLSMAFAWIRAIRVIRGLLPALPPKHSNKTPMRFLSLPTRSYIVSMYSYAISMRSYARSIPLLCTIPRRSCLNTCG